MRILFLASGGDAPGMNFCLYNLCKNLKKYELFASLYGFKGLVDGNIIPISKDYFKNDKYSAGVAIKTSRCPEFKTKKGFKNALENLNKNNIDFVIILGGDGSLKGAKELAKNNIKVIFIPATIDNDIEYETIALGHYTAVKASANYVKNVMPSMQAFDRSCIFEVMGRYDGSIAKLCGKMVNADLIITGENANLVDDLKIVSNKKSKIVILQENLLNISALAENLSKKYDCVFKTARIGYVQRGTAPIKSELALCKIYANLVTKAIKDNNFNIAVQVNNNCVNILNILSNLV